MRYYYSHYPLWLGDDDHDLPTSPGYGGVYGDVTQSWYESSDESRKVLCMHTLASPPNLLPISGRRKIAYPFYAYLDVPKQS